MSDVEAESATDAGEDGSATLEFLALGILLLIPLVYLVLLMARVQGGAFAASEAARESGRAFVTAASDADGEHRARVAAGVAFSNYGLADEGRVAITCDESPCLTPNARIVARANADVPLPLVPGFLSGVLPLSVPVSARHDFVVDRFRGTG